MKWELSSINQYLDNREYVDTAIIPVIKIHLGEQTKDSIRQATWLTGLSHKVEEQLAGRILLFPAHSISAASEMSIVIEELQTYALYLREHQFNHVLFLHNACLPEENLQEEKPYQLLDLGSDVPDTDQFKDEDFSQRVQELSAVLIKLWQK